MPTYAKLKAGQRQLSQNTTDLGNGQKMVTEVIQTGPNEFLTGNILIDKDGAVIMGTWCGTCDGTSVGCVDCPNNDPVLNCVNRTISCAS